MNIIKRWKPNWVNTHGALYIRDIKDGNIKFKKVVTPFKNSLYKNINIRNEVVTKGYLSLPLTDKILRKRLLRKINLILYKKGYVL